MLRHLPLAKLSLNGARAPSLFSKLVEPDLVHRQRISVRAGWQYRRAWQGPMLITRPV